MEKEFENEQIPTWAKNWLSLAEASLAIQAAGIPNHSLPCFRNMIKAGRVPITAEKFGQTYFCVKEDVINYIRDLGGTYHEHPQPSGFDPDKWVLLAEAIKQIQAAGIPCQTASAMRKALLAGKLPFAAQRFGARYFVNRADLQNYINRLQKLAGI